MAKRRNKHQIEADKIIKKNLMELGEKILEQSVNTSRVAKTTFYKTDRVKPKGTIMHQGGELRDSQNFRFEGDTTLVMFQTYYGAYNYPKGKNSGDKNALLIAVNEHASETTNIIVTEINDAILQPFKK